MQRLERERFDGISADVVYSHNFHLRRKKKQIVGNHEKEFLNIFRQVDGKMSAPKTVHHMRERSNVIAFVPRMRLDSVFFALKKREKPRKIIQNEAN